MPVFLLWNLGGGRLGRQVADLAREHSVDVLVLLECTIPVAEMLRTLNIQRTEFYFQDASQCQRVAIYTRFSANFLRPLFESRRFTVQRLNLPGTEEILLAAAHLPSKKQADTDSQTHYCRALATAVARVEDQVGHQRTILLGDLNVNPFEPGLANVDALNAVMSRLTAKRLTRSFGGNTYRFFYNPMWGRFGDATPGPPGTFHRSKGDLLEYHWNMFDQVLLRPTLFPLFHDADLHILTGVDGRSLLKSNGTPGSAVSSDHLPLKFTMALNLAP